MIELGRSFSVDEKLFCGDEEASHVLVLDRRDKASVALQCKFYIFPKSCNTRSKKFYKHQPDVVGCFTFSRLFIEYKGSNSHRKLKNNKKKNKKFLQFHPQFFQIFLFNEKVLILNLLSSFISIRS